MVLLDCTIVCILLIIENNGDISPEILDLSGQSVDFEDNA